MTGVVGCGEVNGLRRLIDDYSSLYLRRSRVSGVTGLVRVDHEAADRRDGKGATCDGAGPVLLPSMEKVTGLPDAPPVATRGMVRPEE